MKIYIRGTGCISPQGTHDTCSLSAYAWRQEDDFMQVVDPGYKNYIDPKQSRRMSKVIKMGVSAAKICLEDAGVTMPGAILTGTGLGCMEDTENFLGDLILNNEQLLTPTPFIQSTHNTVGAQIALMLKCHELNFTYVHRGFSFELALQDAMMHLIEGDITHVLCGGVDELTLKTYKILQRLGVARHEQMSGDVFKKKNGSIYGEGAAFFLLSSEAGARNYGCLSGLDMLLKPGSVVEVEDFLTAFLKKQQIAPQEVDLILYGNNGDSKGDAIYGHIQQNIFPGNAFGCFKHLCGEYHTSTSFAFWLAAKILMEQHIPSLVSKSLNKPDQIKNLIVYNHYQGGNHVVFHLQSC